MDRLKLVARVVLVLSIAVLVLVLDSIRFKSHVPRALDSSSIASHTRNAAIDRVPADLFRQAIS